MSSSPDKPIRRCTACGQPIDAGDDVHAECAAQQEQRRSKAPQKICPACGEKTHVRTLVCKACGAMF